MSDRETVVSEHDTAELACVVDGVPAPTISWIKDGRITLDGSVDARYQLLTSGTLRISDVEVSC